MIRKSYPFLYRYAIAVGLFAALLAVAFFLKYSLGLTNLAILVFFSLIVTSWHGGRGPGILLAVLVEITTIIANPPRPDVPLAKTVFGHFTMTLVLFSFVLIVSSRKLAETKLRQQRELLRVTLSSIGDAVIAADVRGAINSFNPTAEALTGWTQAEAAGRHLNDVFNVIDEKTREPIENPFSIIKSGETSWPAEHTLLVARDGSAIPIGTSCAPILDANGANIGATIVFRDISERRESEHERETLLLAAQAARSEAERANRMKDEFLATVSHELRTPLNAILGWAAMLQNKRQGEMDIAKGLRIIEQNAKTQNAVISDILDVSRIVSGKLRVDPKPIDLVASIRSAVESIYPAAAAKSITINTSFFDSSAIVNGDTARLQQIFWNLMSNAVKFTPKGGTVDIRLLRVDSSFEVLIKDSGVGISEKFLPFVFERFRQIDSSSKRTHGGLGLGLAIVRYLVDLHGGSVSAASEGDGKGTAFSILFPSAAPDQVPIAKTRSEMPDLTGLRVLVVDDEPDTIELLCLMLEERGAQTHAAGSCAAAMEVFADWKPDLVVSDLGMPGEDGFDLINRIRALEPDEGGNIPAAALTAYVSEDDCLDALAAGFQMHIPKPVDPAILASAVADLAKYRGDRQYA